MCIHVCVCVCVYYVYNYIYSAKIYETKYKTGNLRDTPCLRSKTILFKRQSQPPLCLFLSAMLMNTHTHKHPHTLILIFMKYNILASRQEHSPEGIYNHPTSPFQYSAFSGKLS